MTEPAITIHTAHPGNTDTRTGGQIRRGSFDHFPDNLMAWNQSWPNRRQISFHNVQVSAANPASHDSKQHMPGL